MFPYDDDDIIDVVNINTNDSPSEHIESISSSKKPDHFYLNNFNVESDTLIVSDPLFKIESSDECIEINLQIESVKKGLWHGHIIYNDELNRNMELWTYHDDYSDIADLELNNYINNYPDYYVPSPNFKFEKCGDIGVDSGQAGIYCKNSYGKPNMDTWYNNNCAAVANNLDASTLLPFGVVSISGYGDGFYDVYKIIVNNFVVAVKIEFITEENKFMYQSIINLD